MENGQYILEVINEQYRVPIQVMYNEIKKHHKVYVLPDDLNQSDFFNLIGGDNYLTWVILYKSSRKFAGIIMLHSIDYLEKSAEIGIILLPAFQKKAIFKEVFPFVKNYAKSAIRLKTLFAVIHEQNLEAHKAAISNGFSILTKKAKMDEQDMYFRYIYELNI